MADQSLSTKEFLATEYLSLRLNHFKKLAMRTKILILEIVQYYLSVFYTTEGEAIAICSEIILAIQDKDESRAVDCYKRFLEFLPVRIRAGVQGKNLFKQPSQLDNMRAHFYENDMLKIKEFNQSLNAKDEFGLSPKSRMDIMQDMIEQEFAAMPNSNSADVQLER